MRDLVLLVADDNTRKAIEGLLGRTAALGIRKIDFAVLVHPHRDPGVLRKGHDLLRPFAREFQCAIAIFDRDGCGQNHKAEELERRVEANLTANGWQDRSKAIVIDSELEQWVWAGTYGVERLLAWSRPAPLREFLIERGHLAKDASKPRDAKAAFEEVCRATRTPRSSALYFRLAKEADFSRCQDRAFRKLCQTLGGWFPGA